MWGAPWLGLPNRPLSQGLRGLREEEEAGLLLSGTLTLVGGQEADLVGCGLASQWGTPRRAASAGRHRPPPRHPRMAAGGGALGPDPRGRPGPCRACGHLAGRAQSPAPSTEPCSRPASFQTISGCASAVFQGAGCTQAQQPGWREDGGLVVTRLLSKVPPAPEGTSGTPRGLEGPVVGVSPRRRSTGHRCCSPAAQTVFGVISICH